MADGPSREAIDAANRLVHPTAHEAVLAAYPFIRRDVAREVAAMLRRMPVRYRPYDCAVEVEREFSAGPVEEGP